LQNVKSERQGELGYSMERRRYGQVVGRVSECDESSGIASLTERPGKFGNTWALPGDICALGHWTP
jgi:hypothetical protein